MCSSERRSSALFQAALSVESPSNTEIVKLIHELRSEIKNDFKNLESSLGMSIECAHEKIEELNNIIKEQSSKLDSCTNKISELITKKIFLRSK